MTTSQNPQWRKNPVDDFPARKETPWAIGGGNNTADIGDPSGLMGVRRPQTTLQALMETAPGDTPVQSIEDQNQLRDVLADALDEMAKSDADDGPRLLHVFQAHVNRGMSFNQIADEMAISKTHAHHLYGLAQAYLASILAGDPLVAQRLEGEL